MSVSNPYGRSREYQFPPNSPVSKSGIVAGDTRSLAATPSGLESGHSHSLPWTTFAGITVAQALRHPKIKAKQEIFGRDEGIGASTNDKGTVSV